jgi:penicillin-binding protein 1A
MDGWFAGYAADVVGIAWMGYDQPRSLGGREFGATLSLPIWTDYMRVALRGKPDAQRPVPPGLVQVDGDWMYEEYVNGGGVRSVDVEDNRSFLEKLFGGGNAPAPAPGNGPAPVPAPAPSPAPRPAQQSNDMTYRGGG